MVFGFETYDSSGVKNYSSEDFSVMIIDVLTVASTDTDSNDYSGVLAGNIKVAQTQELETIDVDNITVFNQMDVTATYTAGTDTWTVAWSPGTTRGSARDVTLFVLGY